MRTWSVWWRWLPFTLVMLVLGCGSDDDPVAPLEFGTLGDGRLAEVLDVIREQEGLPSLAAVLVQDGAIVEAEAVGVRAQGHSEAVTLGDKWHIGSLTKSMTSTLAAILIEDGSITWETTIGEQLPDLVGLIRSEYEDVRLEELVHHTAGLATDLTRASSWDQLRFDTGPIVDSRLQLAREMLALEPDGTRGAFLYSNAGYVVAGAMLERATGTPWEDLITTRLFQPLGMTSTGFGAPGEAGIISQPRGHERQGSTWRPLEPGPNADNPRQVGPAGTVHTTIADYVQYMVAHLNGARGVPGLLSAEAFETLHTPAPSTASGKGWGLGERAWANGRVLAHSGSNTLWYAVVWLAPERDMGLAAFTNAGGDPGSIGTDRAVSALIARLDG